ncbi:MAG TPA: class I SAM-dependent methyltransferase [Gammaproteobacteria bacterium]|nr:class I SAM-dependent methyltransferase [Gammaproteobacteria bacterium]
MRETISFYLKKLRWWNFWGDHFNSEQMSLKGKTVLEIGAGQMKRPGVMSLDLNSLVNPDIVHDLDNMPWPIPDASFDAIYMFSVIEHLLNPLKVIEECHRVLKPNGKLFLLTPHFSSTASYTDLTHRWHFSSRSFDYFVVDMPIHADYGFYSVAHFAIEKRIISLHGVFNYVPFLQWLANKRLYFWEDYLSFIVRGSGIYIVLRKQT